MCVQVCLIYKHIGKYDHLGDNFLFRTRYCVIFDVRFVFSHVAGSGDQVNWGNSGFLRAPKDFWALPNDNKIGCFVPIL